MNERADAVAQLAAKFSADLVHAGIIRRSEVAAFRARGLPFVMTVHTRPQAGRPASPPATVAAGDLLIACSKSGRSGIEPHELGAPVRVVWNGINPRPLTLSRAWWEAARLCASRSDGARKISW